MEQGGGGVKEGGGGGSQVIKNNYEHEANYNGGVAAQNLQASRKKSVNHLRANLPTLLL
jgi:hypothetical protein